jgi:hypothetical protein
MHPRGNVRVFCFFCGLCVVALLAALRFAVVRPWLPWLPRTASSSRRDCSLGSVFSLEISDLHCWLAREHRFG